MEVVGSNSKNSLGKELAIRVEELGSFRALEPADDLEGEDTVSLPSKFVHFSNSMGMLVVGFDKKISSLLKNLEARKRSGVKISSGKRNHLSTSHLEKELRKLECAVSYKSSPCSLRGTRRE